MPSIGLGRIRVGNPGSPIQATVNLPRPAERQPVNTYWAQALPGNSGLVYVGSKSMNKATGVGVFFVVPVPTLNATGVPIALPLVQSPNGSGIPVSEDLSMVYVDADFANDGCFISGLAL